MQIDYCYHTHTYRCGHAVGEDEAYVLAAIESGIKVLGFTDHVMLPGYSQPGIRGEYSMLEDYISSINALKEKYKDKIEIHLGFECEYYPQFLEYYSKLKSDFGVEYLILGQHCFINKDNKLEWQMTSDTKECVDRYVENIISGMKTKLFAYVAHPDLYIYTSHEWNEILEEAAHKICQASVKYNVPLEINLGRFNKGNKFINHLMYPDERFWKIAGQYKCKAYIGRDAHSPMHLLDPHFDYALDIAKKYGIEVLTRI